MTRVNNLLKHAAKFKEIYRTRYQKPVWNGAIVLCQLSCSQQGEHSRTGEVGKLHTWKWRVKTSGHAVQSETHQTYVNIQQEHTEIVKAPWGQPLREVGGKQEAGEESKEEVVTVTGQGVAVAAAAPAAQKDLETEKNNRQGFFFFQTKPKTPETERFNLAESFRSRREEKNKKHTTPQRTSAEANARPRCEYTHSQHFWSA